MSTEKKTIQLAYVIPTKDRPDDLRKMLASVARQSRLPQQIVVVDGSEPEIDHVLQEFPELPLTYVRVFPPSLSKQRNAGMAAIHPTITHAGYMDDDLELEANATEKMFLFLEAAAPEVGGFAFSVINQPLARSPGLARFFLLNDPRPGRLLCSGFQTQIPFVKENIFTDWLYGGATIWTRPVISEFQYDEWYIGTGYLEDVDYSYRVRQKYDLCIVGEARLNHYSKPIPVSKNRILGKQQVVNRVYFFKKCKAGKVPFSWLAFSWALTAQFFHNLVFSLRTKDKSGYLRALGNLDGLIHLMRFGTRPVMGHFK